MNRRFNVHQNLFNYGKIFVSITSKLLLVLNLSNKHYITIILLN